MSTPDPNWSRWIYSSCAKHFNAGAEDFSLPCFVEGDERNTDNLKQWIEVRLDGPYMKEVSRNYWRIDVEVNIFIGSVSDNQYMYDLQSLTGKVASMFGCIPVTRTGDPIDDPANDGVQIGILDLKKHPAELIRISNFGKVRPDTRFQQATVEGHYEMYLSL